MSETDKTVLNETEQTEKLFGFDFKIDGKSGGRGFRGLFCRSFIRKPDQEVQHLNGREFPYLTDRFQMFLK